MLFHVTAKHNYETCPAIQSGFDSDKTVEFQRWIEGNEDVKVLGVWGYQLSHTAYAVLESDDMQSVTTLLRPQMGRGNIEIVPVMDNMAMRKEKGQWGK